MGVLNFSDWLALSPVRATRLFGSSSIWSTVFSDQMSMLVEICIKMRPSTFASLNQEIAVHSLLGGHVLGFDTVFQVKPGIDCLGKSNSVAGAAWSLVSMIIQEVISLNISEIMLNWQLRVRNLISMVVCLLPLLSKLQCFHEISIIFVSEWLFCFIFLDICKHVSNFRIILKKLSVLKNEIIAAYLALSVSWVLLLKFASVQFKAKFTIVHCGNQKICLFGRLVLFVQVFSILSGSFRFSSSFFGGFLFIGLTRWLRFSLCYGWGFCRCLLFCFYKRKTCPTIMISNKRFLIFISMVDHFSCLYIILHPLVPIKALSSKVFHIVFGIVHHKNRTYHSLIANRIEQLLFSWLQHIHLLEGHVR